MTEVVAVYQPHYYPQLHYLARAQEADIFVIYDDVQFSRGSSQHRASIDHQGQTLLTLPIRRTGVDTTIEDACIDMSEPWPEKHLKTLVGTYGEEATELRPFYEQLCPTVVHPEYLRENTDKIADHLPGDSSDERLADWLQCDEKVRDLNHERELLQTRKEQIGKEISQVKADDPNAAIDDLVADAEDVASQLSSVEETCQELKSRRNEELIAISGDITDDVSVDELPLKQRWKLDGVDFRAVAEPTRLVDLTVPLLEHLLQRFDVTSRVVRSSELAVEPSDDASDYLARLTEHLGGDSYISGGVGYENYLDKEPFDERGLDVLVQEWTPTWDDGNVCALDVLYGSDDPATYIR